MKLSNPSEILNHYKKYYIQYERDNYSSLYEYVLDTLLYDLQSRKFDKKLNVYELDTVIRTLLSLILYREQEKEKVK